MLRSLKPLAVAVFALGGTSLFADNPTGAYLAARHASLNADYAAAGEYYLRALAADPNNPLLLESAVTSLVGTGEVDRALPLARKMYLDGLDSQVANLVVLAGYFSQGDYAGAQEVLGQGITVGTFLDRLAVAWAQVGQGDVSGALASFEHAAEVEGSEAFAYYNMALTYALVGDYQSADDILGGRTYGPLPATRNGILTHIQVLSQVGRHDDALQLLELAFSGQLAQFQEMRAALSGQQPIPFDVISSATDGMSEAFYDIADAIQTEVSPTFTLIYTRMALELDPDHVSALLLAGAMLDELGQYDLSMQSYSRVPADHPRSYIAEIGRANAMIAMGRTDAAIEVLSNLADRHPELPFVHVSLADALQDEDRYQEATDAYSNAVELDQSPDESQWRTFFARAISYERRGMWPEAEADFRHALELSPGQPFVLNYLGYSLVERREKLDEALSMIEAAVEAQPQNGYIVDSLGWVLFRLGRYDEAVVWMERAVALEPTDPVLSDHLGDTLWAVGRYREAEFQWSRALSFAEYDETGEINPERIRRKLEFGLDQVLAEEGAEPLRSADDN